VYHGISIASSEDGLTMIIINDRRDNNMIVNKRAVNIWHVVS